MNTWGFYQPEEQKMTFRLFDRKRTHGGPPKVTITKYGMFVVNSTAVEKYLHGAQYALLYWDDTHEKVGIKPIKTKEQKAYRLNYSPKGNVATLSGTAFLGFAEIPHDATQSFDAGWNEEEKLLEFQVQRARKAKQKV
jgi:hypothetical protein